MRTYALTLELAGATGEVVSDIPLNGVIMAARLEYSGVLGTTSITVVESDSEGNAAGFEQTILDAIVGNTDTTYHPQTFAQQTDGTTSTTLTPIALAGNRIKMSAASSSAGTVTLKLGLL